MITDFEFVILNLYVV